MATSDGLTGMLAAAHAQVRGVNWASWQVPPGDARLAEYVFADEPGLTNSLLQGYFSTCSWLWQRPIAPDEGQRAATALMALWTEHGIAQEFEPLVIAQILPLVLVDVGTVGQRLLKQ